MEFYFSAENTNSRSEGSFSVSCFLQPCPHDAIVEPDFLSVRANELSTFLKSVCHHFTTAIIPSQECFGFQSQKSQVRTLKIYLDFILDTEIRERILCKNWWVNKCNIWGDNILTLMYPWILSTVQTDFELFYFLILVFPTYSFPVTYIQWIFNHKNFWILDHINFPITINLFSFCLARSFLVFPWAFKIMHYLLHLKRKLFLFLTSQSSNCSIYLNLPSENILKYFKILLQVSLEYSEKIWIFIFFPKSFCQITNDLVNKIQITIFNS